MLHDASIYTIPFHANALCCIFFILKVWHLWRKIGSKREIEGFTELKCKIFSWKYSATSSSFCYKCTSITIDLEGKGRKTMKFSIKIIFWNKVATKEAETEAECGADKHNRSGNLHHSFPVLMHFYFRQNISLLISLFFFFKKMFAILRFSSHFKHLFIDFCCWMLLISLRPPTVQIHGYPLFYYISSSEWRVLTTCVCVCECEFIARALDIVNDDDECEHNICYCMIRAGCFLFVLLYFFSFFCCCHIVSLLFLVLSLLSTHANDNRKGKFACKKPNGIKL